MPRVIPRITRINMQTGRTTRVNGRRPARRERRGMVLSKAIGSKIHYFKRTLYQSGAISGSTLLDTFGASVFRLNQVPNFNEFTVLFDQYKICGIKWMLMPRGNSSEIGSNQGQVKFFSVIDYDDNTAPSSITDLVQYENLKVTPTSRDHKRYLVPKVAREVYSSATTTGYSAASSQWIDCTNDAVPHYGLKYMLQQLPAGTQQFDLKVTYYLAFKNVR